MNYLQSKSEFNFTAAKILLEDYDNPASSVHCSYYGCFQLISHKLNNLGHSYADIANEITASKTKIIKLSTHGYPLQLMCNIMKSQIRDSGFSARELDDKMGLLKRFRTKSDYKNLDVTIHQGKEALRLSADIQGLLKKI